MANGTDDWLVVMSGGVATATGDVLTLEAVQPIAIAFTDRPERRVRRVAVVGLVAAWADLFGDSPPNAALTWVAGDTEQTAVAELGRPTATGDRVDFPCRWLEASSVVPEGSVVVATPPEGRLHHVSLFLDSSNPIELGSASNAFTILRPNQNQ